jgi:hypothetical protein
MRPDPSNLLTLALPAEPFRDLAAEILGKAIEKGGVVEAIKTAAAADIASQGLIDKAAAAQFLGVEPRTLEVWMRPVAQGGKAVPHMKIGETVRFRIDQLREWADQYTVNRVLPKVA